MFAVHIYLNQPNILREDGSITHMNQITKSEEEKKHNDFANKIVLIITAYQFIEKQYHLRPVFGFAS